MMCWSGSVPQVNALMRLVDAKEVLAIEPALATSHDRYIGGLYSAECETGDDSTDNGTDETLHATDQDRDERGQHLERQRIRI